MTIVVDPDVDVDAGEVAVPDAAGSDGAAVEEPAEPGEAGAWV
jgi:hypothetical protein